MNIVVGTLNKQVKFAYFNNRALYLQSNFLYNGTKCFTKENKTRKGR